MTSVLKILKETYRKITWWILYWPLAIRTLDYELGATSIWSFQHYSCIIPALFQHLSNIIPVLFLHYSNIIPALFQHYSSIIPASFQHHSSIIPASFQHYSNIITELFQHYSLNRTSTIPLYKRCSMFFQCVIRFVCVLSMLFQCLFNVFQGLFNVFSMFVQGLFKVVLHHDLHRVGKETLKNH